MAKLNSPLCWVGGKSRLRDTIISKIPDHKFYAEVFAGAAWVYFGKQPSEIEAINDINSDLVNLYRVLQHRLEEFEEQLWYMFPSRKLYYEAAELLNANRERLAQNDEPLLTDVERAVLFYYHIKNAFGSVYEGGFGFSRSRPPKQLVAHDFIVKVRDRLSNTYVENLDFQRFIKNYDSPDAFFYCDPPYVVADGTGYYQFVFSEEKHTLLRDILANSQSKFLLSYDDNPLIRKLYNGFKIEEVSIRYSLNAGSKHRKKTELLISNY